MQINKDLGELINLNENNLRGELMSLKSKIAVGTLTHDKNYLDGQYNEDCIKVKQDEQLLNIREEISGLFKTDKDGKIIVPDKNFFENFDKKHNIKTFADFGKFYEKLFNEFADIGLGNLKDVEMGQIMSSYLEAAANYFNVSGADKSNMVDRFAADLFSVVPMKEYLKIWVTLNKGYDTNNWDFGNKFVMENPPPKIDKQPPGGIHNGKGVNPPNKDTQNDNEDDDTIGDFFEGLWFGFTHPGGVVSSLLEDGFEGVDNYYNDANDPKGKYHDDPLGLKKLKDFLTNEASDLTGIPFGDIFNIIFYGALIVGGYIVVKEVKYWTESNKSSTYLVSLFLKVKRFLPFLVIPYW